MSGPFGSSQWMYNAGGAFYDYEIDNSLRFNDNDSARLERTPSSNGNRKTWTFSAWVKIGDTEVWKTLLGSGNSYFNIYDSGNGYKLALTLEAQTNGFVRTNAVFRDPSAWYHIVLRCDTTQATASNRIRIYVNGEQQTSLLTANYPSQNLDTDFNSTQTQGIGKKFDGAANLWDGYMAEVIMVDGQSLDASSFGETKSGIWIPKAYSGSYGTNGFHLEFAGNANDTSGNGNNWTANNISAYDYVPDSPTNNFATFSPLAQHRNGTSFLGKGTLSEGNLLTTNNSDNEGSVIPFAPASGKWYVEFCSKNLAQRQTITAFGNDGFNFASTYVATRSDGGENATGDQSWTTGDIIGVAYDFDNGKVWFAKNNTWYNSSNPATNTGGDAMSALYGFSVHQVSGSTGSATTVFNAGQDSSFAGTKTAQGNTDANGVGDFYYSPPSGFLALCSANLPAPAIDPADDASPTDYFNTVLYTGNGTSQSITGVGFEPSFLWIKNRTQAYSHTLVDSVRDANGWRYLESNTTNAEGYNNTLVNSLDVDGFSVGSSSTTNHSGNSMVAWNWKAGGTASSNTDGSITSSVSASPTSGFSIVTYSGNGTAGATVGHGLGATPKMIIFKIRNDGGDNWTTYHAGIASDAETDGIFLNLTNAAQDNVVFFNDTAPTSSVFSLGNNHSVNASSGNYVAYCFADVDGFSKAGSWIGNASSDGPFIYTGFRPAFILLRESTNTNGWFIHDSVRSTYNQVTHRLYPHLSNGENVGGAYGLDFTSNGFKIRTSDTGWNRSGGTYIYLAFAEQPFKYANAR